jgi:hypothetical protein
MPLLTDLAQIYLLLILSLYGSSDDKFHQTLRKKQRMLDRTEREIEQKQKLPSECYGNHSNTAEILPSTPLHGTKHFFLKLGSLLTPWSRIILEKLTVTKLSRNYLNFMEPKGHVSEEHTVSIFRVKE